jgi:hypothetical protein
MAARKKRAASKKSKSAKKKSARKSTGKKKGTWGGARPGAGRPLGSGQGPSPDSRRNRVAVMFSDTELRKLKTLARISKQPVTTAAYAIIEKKLRRA